MDNGLSRPEQGPKVFTRRVLILIVMDNGLSLLAPCQEGQGRQES